VLLCTQLAAYWLLRPCVALHVSEGSSQFLLDTVPRFTCARRVHPPVYFTPLESAPFSFLFPVSRQETTFLGVSVPSSRHQPAASYVARLPHRTTFPPVRFLTSSTAYAAAGLVGLFHPTATSRVLSSGVLSSQQGMPTRRRHLPLSMVHQNPL